MFDIIKKPSEGNNNGELISAEPCANGEEKITVGENITVETPSEEQAIQVPPQSQKENSLSLLRALGEEERSLQLERSQLASMEEKLAQRVREEVEFKRHRIENLKHEIPELKQRCEALAKALDMPVQK